MQHPKQFNGIYFLLLLQIAFILIGCEATVPLNNPIDPEADSYVGYEVGDKDGDGVSDLYDIDFVNLHSPVNNLETQSNTIEFNWYLVKTATRYHIQVATDSTFATVIYEDDTILTNRYTQIINESGDIYWRVKAGSADRWGDSWSETRIIHKLSKKPTLIKPSHEAPVDDVTPLFTWSLESVVDQYELQIGTTSAINDSIIIDVAEITETNHVLTTDLENNTTYYWRVRAKIEGVWEEWSEVSSFTTAITVGVPYNPMPSDTEIVSNTLPLLTWDILGVPNIFHLQISEVEDFSIVLVDKDDITDMEYQVPDPLEVGIYYWRVKYKDVGGAWGEWRTWSFDVDTGSVILNAPLDKSTSTELLTTFNWSANDKADHYQLQISSQDDFSSLVYDSDAVTGLSYEQELAGGIYYWRVAIIDDNGIKGRWSPVYSCAVFTGLTPSDDAVITDTTPLLDWVDITNASAYAIQINTVNEFSSPYISRDNLATSDFTVPIGDVLTNDTTYYWRITMKSDDTTWWNWSTVKSFTIGLAVDLLTPEDGSATADTTPLFDWEDAPNAVEYQIQVSTSNTFETTIADDTGLTLSRYQMNTALSDNTVYYWRVKMKNNDGVWGDWNDVWSFDVNFTPVIAPVPSHERLITDVTPVLNWEDKAGAVNYHIQVNTQNDFTGTDILNNANLSLSEAQVTTPLENRQTYYWHVKFQNDAGVWGDWSDTWSFTPLVVKSITGRRHVFAFNIDGSLWGAGSNRAGQLGIGDKTDRSVFTNLVSDAKSVSYGWDHTLLVKSDGTVWTAGHNYYGQLGTGDNTGRESFTQVLSDVDLVACDDYQSFCVKTDDTLWAAGSNFFGRLGTGDEVHQNTFTQVLSDVSSVVTIVDHTFALKPDGTLWATGRNKYGQLGTGDLTDRNVFTQVLSDVASVSGTSFHTLALKTDGTLWVTGRNNDGQLGTGDTTDRNAFTQVFSDVDSASCSVFHTLVIKTDGTLWATGSNNKGQLGTGDNDDRSTFTHVLDDVRSIAVSTDVFAIKTDDTLWATGWNYYGQLGVGDEIDRNIFTHVLDDVLSVTGGGSNFVQKTDGTIWLAGDNEYGQLGTGDTTNRNTFSQF